MPAGDFSGRFALRYDTADRLARSRLARQGLARAWRLARLAYWECVPGNRQLCSAAGNMSDVLGLPPAQLPGNLDEYLLLVPEEERPGLQAALAELHDPAVGRAEFEHRIVSFCGKERVVLISAVAEFNPSGEALSFFGTVQDITPYRSLEDSLKLAAAAINHAGDAIVIFDARGAILSINSAFTRITGYAQNEVLGRQLDALLNRPSGRHDESFYRRLLGRLRTFGRWKGELWARAKDGRGFPMLLSLSEIRDDKGRVSNHVGVFTDVSRQHEYKERLEQLALHDSLTGLPNRALFLDRGKQALAQSLRNRSRIGLIFVDLDLFKSINDSYGHAVGDEVLREAGGRMRGAMRDGDTVARLGGDEFVVLLNDIDGEHACVSAAERLLEAVTQPYLVKGLRVRLGASLGISLSPDHGCDIHLLLQRADHALYSIKRDEGQRYAIWMPDMPDVTTRFLKNGTAEA